MWPLAPHLENHVTFVKKLGLCADAVQQGLKELCISCPSHAEKPCLIHRTWLVFLGLGLFLNHYVPIAGIL